MSEIQDLENRIEELETTLKALELTNVRMFAVESFAKAAFGALSPEDQDRVHDALRRIGEQHIASIRSISGSTDIGVHQTIFDTFVADLFKSASH